MLGLRPSSLAAPSIWYELVATPNRKPAGKSWRVSPAARATALGAAVSGAAMSGAAVSVVMVFVMGQLLRER
ncbi:hypothetical protein [Deinococcus aquaticus]|uniref:hypothetical protein n=1 Tax=Deinococcus aquaticus TaxID=328692 RepID=UPI0036080802